MAPFVFGVCVRYCNISVKCLNIVSRNSAVSRETNRDLLIITLYQDICFQYINYCKLYYNLKDVSGQGTWT